MTQGTVLCVKAIRQTRTKENSIVKNSIAHRTVPCAIEFLCLFIIEPPVLDVNVTHKMITKICDIIRQRPI